MYSTQVACVIYRYVYMSRQRTSATVNGENRQTYG